jgi:very-short-patch-repair endonuclease
MGYQKGRAAQIWALVERQHGVVSRAQLLAHGLAPQGIKRRVQRGRLHPVRRGVYAVGRPALTREGRWVAALLACGEGAALSHGSAAARLGIGNERGTIEISVEPPRHPHPAGLRVHRRRDLSQDVICHDGLAVTNAACTIVDLASYLAEPALDRAINDADKLDLIDPERLRVEAERQRGRPGAARLIALLDRHTFTLTDSELERRFLPLVRAAGLPEPRTRERVNGFRVDFHWPDLGLVVETDGLRYHRTPASQARDRARDQAHAAAGLTALRFTHGQIAHAPEHVRSTLAAVAGRITSVA